MNCWYYWRWSIYLLGQQSILWILFIINSLGTFYGYIWYAPQLAATDWWLWPFVPDSPTASLFFTFTLLALLLRKHWRLLEAFAAVTLFKYGIWASVMIIWNKFLGGDLSWQHYMLLFSHIGMALQALLYSPYFTFKLKHLLVVAIWTLTNDMMDYPLGIHPWLNYQLLPFLSTIFMFTISLSLVSLFIFYFSVVRRRRSSYGENNGG